MTSLRSAWRPAALGLTMLALLAPIQVGAETGPTCDDFNDPAAAQLLLDVDPRAYAAELDANDDGVACNDDAESDSGSEGAVTDETAYLELVAAESAAIADQIDAFEALLADYDDARGSEADELLDELTAIAESWAEYPETAEAIEAPESLEAVDDAYQTLVLYVGESGTAWAAYAELVADGEDTDEAREAFDLVYGNISISLEDLNAEVADQDSSAGSDLPEGEAGEYLLAVETHVNELVDSHNRFVDLLYQDGGPSVSEQQEITEIHEFWADAPDQAAELDVPEGYDEVQEAYVALADSFAAEQQILDDFLAAEPGSPEEDEAWAAHEENIANMEELVADVRAALADAGL